MKCHCLVLLSQKDSDLQLLRQSLEESWMLRTEHLLRCANLVGTYRSKCLVTGEHLHSCCFGGINLIPVHYANRYAWISRCVSSEWLHICTSGLCSLLKVRLNDNHDYFS